MHIFSRELTMVDGWDESRRMLEESYRQGIRYIVATPIIPGVVCLPVYMSWQNV